MGRPLVGETGVIIISSVFIVQLSLYMVGFAQTFIDEGTVLLNTDSRHRLHRAACL